MHLMKYKYGMLHIPSNVVYIKMLFRYWTQLVFNASAEIVTYNSYMYSYIWVRFSSI